MIISFLDLKKNRKYSSIVSLFVVETIYCFLIIRLISAYLNLNIFYC